MEDWLLEIEETQRDKVVAKYDDAKSMSQKIKVLYEHHPRGYINPIPVQHLDEFFKCVRLTATTSSWYRGQPKEYKSLRPKIYRELKENDIDRTLSLERDFFFEFRRRAKPSMNFVAHDDLWSWYFLIQHYGGPTRLMDWSNNAAVALFMALDNERDSKDNPIVYSLNATALSDNAYADLGLSKTEKGHVLYPGENITNGWITNISEGQPNLPLSPIALLPSHIDSRISAQKSCFTLFGRELDGFIKDNKEILCPCCDRRILHKIIIDGDSKEQIRKELMRIGISSETVYPGLEGLAKDIYQEIFP